MVIFRNLVVMIVMLLMSISADVQGQCRYSLVPIQDETRPLYSWAPQALNIGAEGTLTVNWYSRSNNGQRSGLWRQGSLLTNLEVPDGANYTTAIGIVDATLVVGHARDFDNQNMQAMLWIDGEAHLLPTPGRFHESYALDVNRHGLVIGGAYMDNNDNSGFTERPVLWKHGEFRELEMSPENFARAEDLNDRGIIVGYMNSIFRDGLPSKIVLWKHGRLRVIGRPKNAISAVSYAINDQGVIVGEAKYASGRMYRPISWHRGKFSNLLLPPGVSSGGANDINEFGQVVGSMRYSTNQWYHGGVWIDGIPHDLNMLILDSEYPEYILYAYKINDRGQILVIIGGGFSALLVPVDSPAGDIDKNCIVNENDLLLLVREFGNEDSYADVDEDGDVDRDDLLLLIRNFGASNVP